MTTPPFGALLLPLAAPGDWLEALLPILFVLFWVVSQVMNIAKALRGQARRPPAPEPVARPAPRPPDAVREELARQIDAFRRGQAEGPRPPAPVAPPVPKPREGRAPPREAVTSGPRRAGSTPPPQRPAVSRPAPRPAGLSGSSTFGGHAGEIARHVEGAFAHDLSHSGSGVRPDLDAGSGRAAPVASASGSPGSTATDLVAMIRDPSTLRRVILLREILDRPVDRW